MKFSVLLVNSFRRSRPEATARLALAVEAHKLRHAYYVESRRRLEAPCYLHGERQSAQARDGGRGISRRLRAQVWRRRAGLERRGAPARFRLRTLAGAGGSSVPRLRDLARARLSRVGHARDSFPCRLQRRP